MTAAPPPFLLQSRPPPRPQHGHSGSRHYAGAVYAVEPGYRPLKLDLWVPVSPEPPPVVVYVHGGAFMLGDRRTPTGDLRPDQVFEELLDAGLAVATIDYRHAREAGFPAQLHDAKAAVRWLRAYADELGIDAIRTGIWGESAGGHIAALVALTADRPELEGRIGVTGESSRVDVVVDWFGLSDVATMPNIEPPPHIRAAWPPELLVPPLDVLLAGLDAAGRADASPVNHVRPGAPPFLLVHGTADAAVPFGQSELLAEALSKAGAEVVLDAVTGAGHGFAGYPEIDAVVQRSVAYLVAALAPVG
jgi:acetyl esterase/lipase